MSSSVLYQRLGELRTAGLLDQDGDGRYALTPLGESQGAALDPIVAWAERWAEHMAVTQGAGATTGGQP